MSIQCENIGDYRNDVIQFINISKGRYVRKKVKLSFMIINELIWREKEKGKFALCLRYISSFT